MSAVGARLIGSRLFRAVGATFVVAFVAVFGAYYVAHLETNPHVYTDVPLYLPFETVHITATGMDTAVSYDVVVVRPDGSVATAVGDGSLIPPAPYDAVAGV